MRSACLTASRMDTLQYTRYDILYIGKKRVSDPTNERMRCAYGILAIELNFYWKQDVLKVLD